MLHKLIVATVGIATFAGQANAQPDDLDWVDWESVDAGEVKPESNFQNDLGADSLDTVELVMALEEAFDIEIPDEAAEGIATVGDAVKYIEDKQA